MFKKLLEKEMLTARRYRAVFTTVDGKEHKGCIYNWMLTNRVINPERYIMIDIQSDGYIEDSDGIMYIINNVVSINWQIVEERKVEDKYSEYQIFVETLKE